MKLIPFYSNIQNTMYDQMLSAFEVHKFKPEMIHFKDDLGNQI